MKKLIIICTILSLSLGLNSCNLIHDMFVPHQTWRPGKIKTPKAGKNHVIHRERLTSL